MVSPEQFLGIEIKPWAKEITELVLWIGWLQWQIRTRGYRSNPPEPILRDYHNIELRDAVLEYDEKVPLLDETGDPVTRWDGETMKLHPVTGEEVPDEAARTPVYRYVNPRKAEWPKTDFVVGNPPFIGNKRMRQVLGDGYVEALRDAHSDVPETADFVMYWWNHAANLVRKDAIRRFGLITTNSITHPNARKLVSAHLQHPTHPASLVFAVPDHPWADSESGAAVRIGMTVGERGKTAGWLHVVIHEAESDSDAANVLLESKLGNINADLTIGADVSAAVQLQSNENLSFMGVTLVGDGFRLAQDEVGQLGYDASSLPNTIRPYLTARELTQLPENRYVIDFFGTSADDAQREHGPLYQRLADRVLPERRENKREAYRKKWWLFGEPRSAMREALAGLRRYIATPETSKHRVFLFLSDRVLPDHSIFAIALDDAYFLAVLSGSIHGMWADSAGSRIGFGNDLRWRNRTCFDPFPFPYPEEATRRRISELGEKLDAHRRRQQQLHPDLTITGMYNVLEKLRGGEDLTAKEKVIHEKGLVSVLKQIHDDLDAAVFDAYGWQHDLSDDEILERLVALNAERADEERRGIIRWLRPEFQNPSGKAAPSQVTIGIPTEEKAAAPAAKTGPPKWPGELPQQIAALRDLVVNDGGRLWSAEEAAKSFKGARRAEVESVLDALAAVGLLVAFDTADGKRWRAAA